MSKEWFAICKDCGSKYGYSHESYQLSLRRGQSRPERCPACRKLHSREIASLGLSHYDLVPVNNVPIEGLEPGRLGGLSRLERVHEYVKNDVDYNFDNFGIQEKHICDFFDIMLTKQVSVIVAPTGAGKSTLLPFRLLVPPTCYPSDLFTRNGQIIITQPRIQATRNIPLFVAKELYGSSLGAGFDIGFRHSGASYTDWRNKLVFMTDGTLINMIVRNELDNLSVIMIDEAHERSLNIDLILGLLKNQLHRYPKLKIIISSATINAGMFLEYYGGPAGFDPDEYRKKSDDGSIDYDNEVIAKLLKDSPVGFFGFPGKRQYPVETRFRLKNIIPLEQFSGRMPEELAKKALKILTKIVHGQEVRGDILGFLQGEDPINRAVEIIRAGIESNHKLAGKAIVLPLYTKLPQKQQDLALLPKSEGDVLRVVVSTNVAETSLTVHGIVHVIDSGLINESQWDPKTQTSIVVSTIHSQAGCKQRWGRGGRVQPGIAHCLYSKKQFETFPKYTTPGILRSPLEKIVLTAKAAGVNDITTFDWIQRPAQEELERAPVYLTKIGAIDEDGDLTEHGFELRNFDEKPDIANLMILADKFGCAIEMATLLPMYKIGTYKRFLRWNRGWDATTKRAVHKIHQGLIFPCIDDLELSLKLWHAWESAGDNDQRREWSAHHFVDHSLFEEIIAIERDNLLASLSVHRKDEAARFVDFNLLDRLRLLFVYGLPNQVYFSNSNQDPNQPLEHPMSFQPYYPEGQSNIELEALHQDASIEIDPDSICSRMPMKAFVCGKRKKGIRRLSPLVEPQTIITASFIVRINKDWLQFVNISLMDLAREISIATKDAEGKFSQLKVSNSIMIDQLYPIGSSYLCEIREDKTHLLYRTKDPSKILPNVINEDMTILTDDDEEQDFDENLFSTCMDIGEQIFIVENPEDIDLDVVNHEIEEEDLANDKPVKTKNSNLLTDEFNESLNESIHQFADVVVLNPPEFADETKIEAVIKGYEFSQIRKPKILLEIPPDPEPFKQFAEKYKVGDTVKARVVGVEKYLKDRFSYLVLSEVDTQFEFTLDPFDASFCSCNFVIDLLKPDSIIDVTIDQIDYQSNTVRVNRLKQAEEALLKFVGKGLNNCVEAQIVEVRDYGLYVWLNPNDVPGTVPLASFVHIGLLPNRPDEMCLGKSCTVNLLDKNFKQVYKHKFPRLSEELVEALGKFQWDKDLTFDRDSLLLNVKSRMSYYQRTQLLALSSDPQYQKAINRLFRNSNEISAKVIDFIGLKNLESVQGSNPQDGWQVIGVSEKSVKVQSPDGYIGVVKKRKATQNQNQKLTELYKKGDTVPVSVQSVDWDKGVAELSLINPANDPLKKLLVGGILEGEVINVLSEGAFIGAEILLADGVVGRVHLTKLAWWTVDNPSSVLSVGQTVRAKIISIDYIARRVNLSLQLDENDPLKAYPIGKIIKGTIVKFRNNGEDADVEIALGVKGLISRGEVGWNGNLKPKDVFSVNQEVNAKIIDITNRILILSCCKLNEYVLEIPPSYVRLVIGKEGKTIKEIQKSTQTRIFIENHKCKIQSESTDNILSAKAKIEKILNTRLVNFKLPNQAFIGKLVGIQGETLKRINTQSNCQVVANFQNCTVRITAPDDQHLKSCLDLIYKLLYRHTVIIQIPPNKAGLVIGRNGENVKRFNRLEVSVSIARDGSGRTTLEGPGVDSIQKVFDEINKMVDFQAKIIQQWGFEMPEVKNLLN